MCEKRYVSTHQYEPLRAPANWTAEERRFIQQLSDVLDDIYRRFGRLRIQDLGAVLRQTITDVQGNYSEIVRTAERIEQRVATTETEITYTGDAVDTLASRVSDAETGLAAAASDTDVAALENRVSTAESTITQHADQIALRVTAEDVSGMTVGRVVASHITIEDDNITIESGGDFDLKAGDTAGEYLGISTTDPTTIYTGAENEDGDNPKFSVSKYGEATMRDANISGEIEVSGTMTFGNGVSVVFRDDAARQNFMKALTGGTGDTAIDYGMGGTGATTRADALRNFGFRVGSDEVTEITAENIGDRYLLIKDSSLVTYSPNSAYLSPSGYYYTKTSTQRRKKTVELYTLASGNAALMPSNNLWFDDWYDTGTPTNSATESAGAAYCYEGVGVVSGEYTGAETITTTTGGTGSGSNYCAWHKKTKVSYEYRTISRSVYWTVCSLSSSAFSSGELSAAQTATLSIQLSASNTCSVYSATGSTGESGRSYISSRTGPSISIDVLDRIASLGSGSYYIVLESGDATPCTVQSVSLSLTFYSTGTSKRAEEYVWNGSEWLKIAEYGGT